MVSCREIINPVDPESDLYIGHESIDNDGDGIGSYEDVDEITIARPSDGVSITDGTNPELTIQLLNPEVITAYRIQISTDSTFLSNIIFDDDSLLSNIFNVPAGTLANNTTYYWRAKAFDGVKWSDDWSIIWSFTVAFSDSEINVKQGGSNIPTTNGSYDFGSVTEGSSSSLVTFEIENTGSTDLILNGNPIIIITGTDSSMFNIGTQPLSPVGAGSDTTFTITFSPTSTGNKSASVTIPNNDSDEDPYTFTISGECTPVVPESEINIKQGATNIPSTSGSYDFESVTEGSSSSSVSFTIENTGSADLILTGSPNVSITGTDASMFSIGTQSLSPVSAGSNTVFAITFNPTSIGNKSALVTIPNNDSDEDPYTISITGYGADLPVGEWDSTNWDECLWAN